MSHYTVKITAVAIVKVGDQEVPVDLETEALPPQLATAMLEGFAEGIAACAAEYLKAAA